MEGGMIIRCRVSLKVSPSVTARLKALVQNISGSTDLEVDTLWPSRTIGFEAFEEASPTRIWHQDGDGYWLGWSTYNQVKFDIAVLKPDAASANVEFVPFDALRACDTPFHDAIERRGLQHM